MSMLMCMLIIRKQATIFTAPIGKENKEISSTLNPVYQNQYKFDVDNVLREGKIFNACEKGFTPFFTNADYSKRRIGQNAYN